MVNRRFSFIVGLGLGVSLAAASASQIPAADFTFTGFGKAVKYSQIGTEQALVGDTNGTPYQATFIIDGLSTSPSLSVSGVNLTGPNSVDVSPSLGAGQSSDIQQPGRYSSQSALDAAYPDGTYALTVNTVNDGTKNFSLNLTGDSYPTAPYITNWTDLQSVNPYAPINIDFDAMSNAAPGDYIHLNIDNPPNYDTTLFASPGLPGQAGGISSTATDFTVPANTFQPGQIYHADIVFVHMVSPDTTTYPGAEATAYYAADTHFIITTTPEPAPLALLGIGAIGLLLLRRKRRGGPRRLTVED